jgi:F-type H+-transporting ATPase subunit epsilon
MRGGFAARLLDGSGAAQPPRPAFAIAEDDMADTFTFELVSPERLLLSEPVAAVVVPGSEGELTILAGHAPFLTTLRPGILTVTDAAGKHRRFFVRGGLADAGPSSLTVLADKALPAADVKGEIAAAEVAAVEAEVARGGDDIAQTIAAQRLADVKLAVEAAANAPAAHGAGH